MADELTDALAAILLKAQEDFWNEPRRGLMMELAAERVAAAFEDVGLRWRFRNTEGQTDDWRYTDFAMPVATSDNYTTWNPESERLFRFCGWG